VWDDLTAGRRRRIRRYFDKVVSFSAVVAVAVVVVVVVVSFLFNFDIF
jgi:hypothetical protein